MTRRKVPAALSPTDSARVLARVLEATATSVGKAKAAREADNARRAEQGKAQKPPVKEQLSESIYFGRHFGKAIASALNSDFGGQVISGETPSASAEGE